MMQGGKIQRLLEQAGVVGSPAPAPASTLAHADKDAGRYRDRILALPNAAAIADKTALLVGLGSVGSPIGVRLVQMGAEVIGFDADVLAVENLIRWGLPATIDLHVGRPKAAVWQELLEATVPGARVVGRAADVVTHAAELDAVIAEKRPDLLIAATDTADSRRTVNAMAARHRIPAIFVGLSDGAASVRVEVVKDAASGPCGCSRSATGHRRATTGRRRRCEGGGRRQRATWSIRVSVLDDFL